MGQSELELAKFESRDPRRDIYSGGDVNDPHKAKRGIPSYMLGHAVQFLSSWSGESPRRLRFSPHQPLPQGASKKTKQTQPKNKNKNKTKQQPSCFPYCSFLLLRSTSRTVPM